ncbi:hypothetical protein D3C74_272480 [compost metagenome]
MWVCQLQLLGERRHKLLQECLIFGIKPPLQRTVDIQYPNELVSHYDRYDNLAIGRRVAGDVSRKGVDIFDPQRFSAFRTGPAHAFAERDPNTGR